MVSEGTVIRFEKSIRGPGPRVRISVDGKDFVVRGQVALEGKCGHKRRETLKVVCPPNDPVKGKVDSFAEHWG